MPYNYHTIVTNTITVTYNCFNCHTIVIRMAYKFLEMIRNGSWTTYKLFSHNYSEESFTAAGPFCLTNQSPRKLKIPTAFTKISLFKILFKTVNSSRPLLQNFLNHPFQQDKKLMFKTSLSMIQVII